jgi:hypothetical protein
MVVRFEVTFTGGLAGLAPTVVEADEYPEGLDYEAMEGHIISYLRGTVTRSRYIKLDIQVTGEVGSGVIYVGHGKRLGDFRLRRLEVSSAG